MAVTYTWKISTCDYNVATGGIDHVHWRCVASEGDIALTTMSVAKLEYDASSSDFIPYADVAENNALDWVWESLREGEETATQAKDRVEANLSTRVAEKQNPTDSQGLPWAS
jgi:hypothetical protein|tara:strand:+ start:1741 stop:2076 length:336 start_codon:yes stop_codon:yes gene_type:complete